ncbi:hypothetical protein WJX73_006405 [Symbiochloris irregularis]|uniref:Protein kinase domain-containing protein n=1 Tax=Symbiochloris irregularis TaxID=706552 RepID=A0AAW1P7V5_9CHLO
MPQQLVLTCDTTAHSCCSSKGNRHAGQHEEDFRSSSNITGDITCNTQHVTGGGAGVGLRSLFGWSTRLVPRQGNGQSKAFLHLWLGFARHQWQRNPDDARETLKSLKYQHIADNHAQLYCQWARLEASAGNREKALALISKGIQAGAEPVSELQSLQAELSAAPAEETKQQEQWATHHNGHTTMYSGLSTGTAFMGPQPPLSFMAPHNPLSRSLSRPGAASVGGEGLFTPTVTLRGGAGLRRTDGSTATKGTAVLLSANTSAMPDGVSGQQASSRRLHSNITSTSSAAVTPYTQAVEAEATAGVERNADRTANSDAATMTSAAQGQHTSNTTATMTQDTSLLGQHMNQQGMDSGSRPRAGDVRRPFRPLQLRNLPRKLGLGPAARVPAQADSAPAPDGQEELLDEGKKRKAERDALVSASPAPPPARVVSLGAKRRQSPDPDQVCHGGPSVKHDSLGPPPPPHQVPSGATQRQEAGSDEDEDTVPFVSSDLARKALAGRHSLAHSKAAALVQSASQAPGQRPHIVQAKQGPASPTAGVADMETGYTDTRTHQARLAQHVHDSMSQRQTGNNSIQAAAVMGADNGRSSASQACACATCPESGQICLCGAQHPAAPQGGSSKVFKVMAPNRKIFALKRIRLTGRDAEAASGFIDEIRLLQSLRSQPNIIQLIDAEVLRADGIIYMVLEYGDIDLARLLEKRARARAQLQGGSELDGNFIRLYWQQMLQAVHVIHEARIVHSDLKPANFLVVEGQLKLIDFGIAKAIAGDTTSIARDAQVGTLNYMAPEAIQGGKGHSRDSTPIKLGRPSDIWSLGCILYQMVYGHTPFAALPFIQKMHAITDPNHVIAYPPVTDAALMDVMQRCLEWDARRRITMQELLQHAFLRPATVGPVERPQKGAAAKANSPGGLTREQVRYLVAHVSAAGSNADLDSLSEHLFKQLAQGEGAQLGKLMGDSAAPKAAEAAMSPQPQQPRSREKRVA